MLVMSLLVVLTMVSFLQWIFISSCFRQPFSEVSSCSVGGLTRPARILDFVMRKILLPRPSYHDEFTRIQQWLIAHLVAEREFDIWDLIESEIEDTIAEGFRGRRQLPYAHWLTYLILRARADPLPPDIQRKLTDTVTLFPHYDPRQMMRTHVDLRALAPPATPRG